MTFGVTWRRLVPALHTGHFGCLTWRLLSRQNLQKVCVHCSMCGLYKVDKLDPVEHTDTTKQVMEAASRRSSAARVAHERTKWDTPTLSREQGVSS